MPIFHTEQQENIDSKYLPIVYVCMYVCACVFVYKMLQKTEFFSLKEYQSE